MLAQSTNAAPPAAISTPGGFGPAPASLEGSSGKKERGAAGLFAEALTLAQKKNETRGRETAKSASDAHGAESRKAGDAEPGPRKKAEAALLGKAARGADEDSAARKPNTAPDPSLAVRQVRLDAEKTHAADTLSSTTAASSARELRSAARTGEAVEVATSATHAAEDKRRVRDRREAPADEASSAALALAGARAQPAVATTARSKAGTSGVEIEVTIEKKPERGATEPKVTVVDLRRSAEARREALSKVEAGKADEAQKDSPRDVKPVGAEGSREVYRELSLEARDLGASPAAGKAEAGQGRSQDFQSIMAERMRESWNGEIVKSAHIVLKDGDAGIIRLRLRPESLGSVKVELNLSENNISGKIIVESQEAKSAFERNMGELSDAFKQGGFDSAKLEVSVGGSGNGASGRADDSGTPFFSERLRSAVQSPGEPATAASAYSRRGAAVDILA